jgi:hypothetical protein
MKKPMSIRRWILIGFAILGALAVLAGAAFYPIQGFFAVGAFELTVTIRPSGQKSISSIIVAADSNLGDAHGILTVLLDPKSDLGSAIQRRFELRNAVRKDPFDGQDLIIQVPYDIHVRQSLIGWPYVKNYRQHQWLLVFAVMEDGERVGKVIEIPHRTEAREVVVTLP